MTKVATKENTRCILIETGIDIMVQKGYNNTGLAEVLTVCNVPKGSFYYYFQSKEDFGLAIINTFDEKYVVQLDEVLKDENLSPLTRLKKYVDDTIRKSELRQCGRGCLIANLSQEMADQNEIFRARLKEIINKRRDCFAALIQQAISAGELSSNLHPIETAEFFLCAWEGAIMRSKVKKDTEPFMCFKRMIFDQLFNQR